jgi:transcriptional regulator with XRE-family HTH domain
MQDEMKVAADAELKKAFMTQLRRHRLAAGFCQSDLARRIGVSVSAVSRWESGMDMPRGRRFKKIAHALGIAPLELTRVLDPDASTAK